MEPRRLTVGELGVVEPCAMCGRGTFWSCKVRALLIAERIWNAVLPEGFTTSSEAHTAYPGGLRATVCTVCYDKLEQERRNAF